MSRGFSYRIDYDKEIANDRKEIAEYLEMIELKLFAREYCYDVCDLALVDGEIAGALGITPEARLCLKARCDVEITDTEDAALPSDWWDIGDRIVEDLEKRFTGHLESPEKTKWRLKNCKQALSRHLRNQKKHGK